MKNRMRKNRVTQRSLDSFIATYQRLARNEEHHMVLESGQAGRYSMIGMKPIEWIESEKEGDGTWVVRKRERTYVDEDPFRVIQNVQKQYGTVEPFDGLPFSGGWMGWIGYDHVRSYVSFDEPNETIDSIVPDVLFYRFQLFAIHDAQTNDVTLLTETENEELIHWWMEQWKEVETYQSTYVESDRHLLIRPNMSESYFVHMVEEVQRAIAEQRVLQVNVSVRQDIPMDRDPLDVYLTLRELNPSPYMAYVSHETFHIVSGSPELFLRKRGNRLETRPIGGTRKRGANPQEEKELERSLTTTTKDIEEHEMLVQLECKDFKNVCEEKSVRVTASRVVEKYSHVMHLVSHVEGTLLDDTDLRTLIKGTFPGGSITGDPKRPTLEMIEQLEPTRRSLYTGAIGWVGWNGDLELNIAIRTAIAEQGEYRVQAGAGLTSDSVPIDEYYESLTKAKALIEALRHTGRND